MSADLSIDDAAQVLKLLDTLNIPFELLLELPAKPPQENEGQFTLHSLCSPYQCVNQKTLLFLQLVYNRTIDQVEEITDQ